MSEEEKMEHLKLVMITALCCSQVLHEALDELKNTDFYRHSFKRSCNMFEDELTKVCNKNIETIFALDEELVMDIMEGMKGVSVEIASMSPERIAALGQLFKANAVGFEDRTS